MKYIAAAVSFAMAVVVPGGVLADPPATTEDFRAQGEAALEALRRSPDHGRHARNVIIFLGDGMGVSTLTAARIWQGQAAGGDGEGTVTAMDTLDYAALVKTYSVDSQVADSAPTATAILTGVKTRNGVIGVGPEVTHEDCASAQGHDLVSLLGLAQQRGLATGIVTTTRITHATPAAAYAHTPGRDWESDKELPAAAAAQGCRDIASQMIDGPVGRGFDVILGGGRQMFLPAGMPDPEYPEQTGERRDGRDLIAAWQAAHPGGSFVWNAAQFAAYRPAPGKPLLGLFEPSHMQYEADRAQDRGGEPALADMVAAAIGKLSQGRDGYVLWVEGGRIDHAHHAGNAYRALSDAAALDAAVARALAMVDLDETLVVVTADHSHTLTIGGYPPRGNPILDTVRDGTGHPARDANGKAYTTLAYANGPGAVTAAGKDRPDPAAEDTHAPAYRQQALVALPSETHGGEDVAVRASGPGAQRFRGTIEQNTIFYLVREALFGPMAKPRPARR